MIWRSPWQDPRWRVAVAVARGDLRNRTGSDHELIDRLVRDHNDRVLDWLAARGRPCTNVLLILPRCVRRRCCRPGPGGDLAHSLGCRECALGSLARTAADLGIRAMVAFRSHLAYRAARRERPELIVATACEDRLVKALCGVADIPSLLTPLTGMERMCVGADFDVSWTERALGAACGRIPPADALPAARAHG